MQTFVDRTTSSKSLISRILLLGVIGIWILILQNMGIIPVAEQKVIVVNRVESTVANTVDVNVDGGFLNTYVDGGYIDVENTVSISIDEVLGRDNQKYYFNN